MFTKIYSYNNCVICISVDYVEISLLHHLHIFHPYLKERCSTTCHNSRDHIEVLQIKVLHMANSMGVFILE